MFSSRVPVASALIILLPTTVHATVRSVPSQYASIQAAVNAAEPGDTVLVAPGSYTENVVINAKQLVLIGDSVSQTTIIQPASNGAPAVRWNNVGSADALLVGFTVEGAVNAPGVLCENSAIHLRRNVIQNNTGSGIRVTGSVTALISDNVIVGNSAEFGGGISLDEGGADISGNIISGNHADLGAGIFSDNRIALQANMAASAIPGFTIRNNIITGNSAILGGGGAYLYEGFPVTFIGNLFAYDTSNSGGGVANSGRYDLHFYNNTFDHCIGGDIGGSAIWWARGGKVGGVIRNNIVTHCSSTFDVGGAIGGDEEVVDQVDIDYNNLWNNSPINYYRLQSGPNALAVDPMYCDAVNGSYFLNAASPCLGSGEAGQDVGAFGAGCQGDGPYAASLQILSEESYHVIDHAPTLTWLYTDPIAAPQTAFELEVGSDADWSDAELWQTGVVASVANLTTYAGIALIDGQPWFARVRVYNGSTWSNWVTSQFRMNTPPSPPFLLSPPNGDDVISYSPTLQVVSGDDAEIDAQSFAFEIYADSALSVLLRSRDFELSFDPPEFWQIAPALPGDGTYWWRARGNDGYEASGWSAAGSFRVDATNDPPSSFALLSPVSGSSVYTQTPVLDWEDATDPDPGDQIDDYTLTLAVDSNFDFASSVTGIPNSSYQHPTLPYGFRYWWRVIARDLQGHVRMAGPWNFYIPSPGDVDGNGVHDLVDIVSLIDIVFRDAQMPSGLIGVDVNGDCIVDVRDVVRLIDYVLRDGPAPNAVCGSQPPSGGQICVPADYPTIQAAVNAALDNDTICIASGTYAEAIVIDGKSIVLLGDTVGFGVSLQSASSGVPILNMINNVSGTCVVLGFRFIGADFAPAIQIEDASVTIRGNRIEDNFDGGVIVYGVGAVRIEGNIFSGNVAGAGAGVLLYYSQADVVGNVFEGNRAYIGGGTCSVGGSGSTVEGNTFRGNHADAGGGGIYLIYEGQIDILRNLFVDDTSDHGGGIDISGRDSVAVLNNTFDNCVGGIGFGGGNAIWWSTNSDTACIFKNNIVTNSTSLNGQGGAVGCDPGVVDHVDLSFNAFFNNSPVDFYRFAPGSATISSDPLYCNPVLGDYRLSPLSPCLGSGEGGLNRGAFGPGCVK